MDDRCRETVCRAKRSRSNLERVFCWRGECVDAPLPGSVLEYQDIFESCGFQAVLPRVPLHHIMMSLVKILPPSSKLPSPTRLDPPEKAKQRAHTRASTRPTAAAISASASGGQRHVPQKSPESVLKSGIGIDRFQLRSVISTVPHRCAQWWAESSASPPCVAHGTRVQIRAHWRTVVAGLGVQFRLHEVRPACAGGAAGGDRTKTRLHKKHHFACTVNGTLFLCCVCVVLFCSNTVLWGYPVQAFQSFRAACYESKYYEGKAPVRKRLDCRLLAPGWTWARPGRAELLTL